MEPKLPNGPAEITDRQLEVAKLVAEGLTNRQIAERLDISLDGAKYHVTQLLVRLTLARREEIGGWYRDRRRRRRWRARALLRPLLAPTPLSLAAGVAAVIVAGAIVFAQSTSNSPPPAGPPAASRPPAATPIASPPVETTPSPTPTATPAPASRAVAQPAGLPRYIEYTVQRGDTLQSIAERFGVGEEYILWNNIDLLADPISLEPDQTLQIPAVEGIIHSIQIGDTLRSIIERYDGDLEATLSFRANNITDPNTLPLDQLVLVVAGRAAPPLQYRRDPPGGTFGGNWGWPTESRLITSFFKVGGHDHGIDIGAVPGTPVQAAEVGTVIFVGGDPCCSYGFHVIIDHGNGYTSLYSQLSRFNVSVGQAVSRGQLIALSGNTGRSTGPHLGFEINRYGIHLNPLAFLP